MSRFSVDLSQLPLPDVVEPLDFEAVLADLKDDLADRHEFVDLESDPLVAVLEVVAYRELLLRARINDAARGCMLATATGADLDNLAALFGVGRLLVSPGDPNAVPPIPATYETDEALRKRAQLAPEAFTSAGSVGAYTFHALSVDGRIVDVEVTSPAPGNVLVTYYAEDQGVQVSTLDAAIATVVSADEVRPLTDTVAVAPAAPVTYDITADLLVGSGPDASVIKSRAEAEVLAYTASRRLIGADVALSGIYAALHRTGVVEVTLTTPTADVVIAPGEVGILGALTITTSTA